jgi:transcriptional regulator with XRE-family HTH domain
VIVQLISARLLTTSVGGTNRAAPPPAPERLDLTSQDCVDFPPGAALPQRHRHQTRPRLRASAMLQPKPQREPKEPSSAARTQQRIYNRRSQRSTGRGLTQQEVAVLLGISERAVRTIERRAIRKLAQHPKLRKLWRQYLAGELTEDGHTLSEPEIEALLGLARSQAELETILRVLEIVQGDTPKAIKLRGQVWAPSRTT